MNRAVINLGRTENDVPLPVVPVLPLMLVTAPEKPTDALEEFPPVLVINPALALMAPAEYTFSLLKFPLAFVPSNAPLARVPLETSGTDPKVLNVARVGSRVRLP